MSSKKDREDKRRKKAKWRRKKQEKRIDTSKSELAERIKERKEFSDSKIIIEAPGLVKMSKVIVDFIEPFLEMAENNEAEEFIVMLSAMSWNANLLPKKEQKSFIKNIEKEVGEQGAEMFKLMRKMIAAYKKEKYPNLNRYILDYQIRYTKDGMHLNVVSSIEPPDNHHDYEKE